MIDETVTSAEQGYLHEAFVNFSQTKYAYAQLSRQIVEPSTDDSLAQVKDLYPTETTSEKVSTPKQLDMIMESISKSAIDESFEDGVAGIFAQRLIVIISIFGENAIDSLRTLIYSNKINSNVVSEALRWVGYINQPASHRSRYHLLALCLYSSSPQIRDGAVIGLSYLKDSSAIPLLKDAAEREQITELKNDFGKVIRFLERHHQ